MNRARGPCCVAVGCSMRTGTNLLSKVKMFRIPEDPERRQAWMAAIRRKNWVPSPHSKICNLHFVTGRPSNYKGHPDWVPSIFSYSTRKVSTQKSKLARSERQHKHLQNEVGGSLTSVKENISGDSNCSESRKNLHEKGQISSCDARTTLQCTIPKYPASTSQPDDGSSGKNTNGSSDSLFAFRDYVNHHSDWFSADNYDCSEAGSPKLVKKQLYIAHQTMGLLEEYEKTLRLENERLLYEMKDTPLIKCISFIKHNATDGDVNALILLNQIALYLPCDT